MEKIWLKHYPLGVPAEIDTQAYPSLVALLEDAFLKYARRPAVACMGKKMCFSDLDVYSRHLAAWLQAQNLRPGARIALMMPNVLQYAVAVVAALRAGYIVVTVNPLSVARELEHQLNDSGAEAIIILENFASVLQQVISRTKVQHVLVTSMGDMLGAVKGSVVNFAVRHIKKMVPSWHLPNSVSFKTALTIGASKSLNLIELKPNDIAFLQYTGGTTGMPKGAMLTHQNLVACILQTAVWANPALHKENEAGEQVTLIIALPMYHIFGLSVCFLLGMYIGGLGVLIPNPRDIKGLIKTLCAYRFHVLPAVNTLYSALLNHPDIHRVDFSSLRVANGGGMAVQEAVAKKWLEQTGCPITECYGLSETSPSVASNPINGGGVLGTIGLPIPSTEVAIRDDANNDLPCGEIGEICIRGPQVMQGYWQRPDETAKVMTPDGYFRSGDIGMMDERGYIKIMDRKKDMIIVSGFNVYPNEIENVIASHPGVLEVAAIGVPDAHSGEVVKLFVVKKDPQLNEEGLMTYCRANFAGYKRPKYIEFCESLPKTTVGKILRRALRQ